MSPASYEPILMTLFGYPDFDYDRQESVPRVESLPIRAATGRRTTGEPLMRTMAGCGHGHSRPARAGLLAALLLVGCSTPKPATTTIASLPPAPPPVMSSSGAPYSVDYSANLQCVPYARLRSGIGIFGDAYTWWDT